jgi:ribonuclease Z
MKLTILGCNGAIPAYGRYPTAQVLDVGSDLYLIDCGEGTQMQMQKYGIKINRINHIFISHLHGDHYFGLIGLLNTLALLGRVKPLYIYGPEPLQAIINLQLEYKLPYAIEYQFTIDQEASILIDNDKYTVESFPVIHSIPTHGFKFTIKRNKRSINKEAVTEYEIPQYYLPQLQLGKDYTKPDGSIISNELLTTAGKPNLSYAYCADTLFTESIVPYITQVDWLYHEATYLHDQLDKATQRLHTTAVQAAHLAILAQPQLLIIGHYSSKYVHPEIVWHQAKAIYANTDYALEGKSWEKF